MGLSEKVALALILVIFNQITSRLCLPRTLRKTSLKNFLSNYKPVSPPVRRSKVNYVVPNRYINEKEVKPINEVYKFPEMEYPRTSKYFREADFYLKNNSINTSMQRINTQNVSKNLQSFSTSLKDKKKVEIVNSKISEKVEQIKPRKYLSPFATQPKPFCFLEEGAFPEVDYPQDISELLVPNYWKRLPETQSKYPIAKPERDSTKNSIIDSNNDAIQKTILALMKFSEKNSKSISETTVLPHQVPSDQGDALPINITSTNPVAVIDETGSPGDIVEVPLDNIKSVGNIIATDVVSTENNIASIDISRIDSEVSTNGGKKYIDAPVETGGSTDTLSSSETINSPEVVDDDMFYTTLAPYILYDTSNLYQPVDDNSFLSPGDFEYIIVKSK